MAGADNLDRRAFTRRCLSGVGAAAMFAGGAVGDDSPPAKGAVEPNPDATEQTPPAELLLLSALIQQYPSEHYTNEIYRNIYREIVGDAARGKQLRAFPLRNHDEPACVFRVVRSAAGDP